MSTTRLLPQWMFSLHTFWWLSETVRIVSNMHPLDGSPNSMVTPLTGWGDDLTVRISGKLVPTFPGLNPGVERVHFYEAIGEHFEFYTRSFYRFENGVPCPQDVCVSWRGYGYFLVHQGCIEVLSIGCAVLLIFSIF